MIACKFHEDLFHRHNQAEQVQYYHLVILWNNAL